MINVAIALNWITIIAVIVFFVDLLRLTLTRAVSWLALASLSINLYDYLIKGHQSLTDFALIISSALIFVLLFTQSKRMDAL